MQIRCGKKAVFLMELLLVVCIACAIPTRIESPTASLEETAKRYYQLKKEGRLWDAWNFERRSFFPARSKEEIEKDIQAYLKREGTLKDFSIIEIGREGSHKEGFTPVKVKLVTDWPPLPMAVPKGDRVLEVVDLWEKIDGKWYHVKAGGLTGKYY